MRKNRIFTIKERKRKKKIRQVLVTFIILLLICCGSTALFLSIRDYNWLSSVVSPFNIIHFDMSDNKNVTNSVETNYDEAANDEDSSDEATPDSINLTLDVMSQELSDDSIDQAVGATIWACKELQCFSDESLNTKIGSILPDTAYEVLEVTTIMNKPYFRIETAFGLGYVNAGYCFINLGDYLGTEGYINLVNTVSSPIKVCGFPINGITGSSVDNMEIDNGISIENWTTLLYPTAVKLKQAIDLATEKGYSLCIYETVRPNSSVNNLHEIMFSQMEKRVAEKTYNGIDIKDYFDEYHDELEKAGIDITLADTTNTELQSKWARSWYNSALENYGKDAADAVQKKLSSGDYEIIVNNLPQGGYVDGKGYIHTADGTEVLDSKGYWTWADFDMIELPTYVVAEGNTVRSNSYGITFRDLMIKEGEVILEDYFEKTSSDYSRGLTVDVSLLNTETDNPIVMQTDIYDMSLMSSPSLNNDSASILEEIMIEAGFAPDKTVWWHFVDIDSKKAYAGIPVAE